MGAETIGGHMVRSLEKAHDTFVEAAKTKKGKELDKEADKLEAELDRLIALMRGDA